MENELNHTRENLQALIEELETTNEEQQASNEELTSSNEELQICLYQSSSPRDVWLSEIRRTAGFILASSL